MENKKGVVVRTILYTDVVPIWDELLLKLIHDRMIKPKTLL
jgi:hypothetical protein